MKLFAEPAVSLIDEPVLLSVQEAQPGSAVTICLETVADDGSHWHSSAQFRPSEDGRIDLSRVAPFNGSYRCVDGMGLFWSMAPSAKSKSRFIKNRLTPLTLKLTADQGVDRAELTLTRSFNECREETLDASSGLVGRFVCPVTAKPAPAVVILPGSDGGIKETAANFLASRGFATLALAYFGHEGLPPDLVEIPLEYFRKAFEWLWRQEGVKPGTVGVVGLSRGGELALLLGSKFPEICAVVAGAPSGMVHVGLSKMRPSRKSAWTHEGVPFEATHCKPGFMDVLQIWGGMFKNKGLFSLLPIFAISLRKPNESSTIAVENTRGSILLISGGDDQLWPAAQYACRVVSRLKAKHFAHAFQHLSYHDAGHFVCFPYSLPYLPPLVQPVRMAFGGSVSENALAAIDSWPKIVHSLDAAFAAKPDDEPGAEKREKVQA